MENNEVIMQPQTDTATSTDSFVNEGLVSEEDGIVQSEFNYQEVKDCIDSHFLNLRNLIKYTKEKDNNISKINADLQKYRDGVEPVLLKSIALSLISYREDCKKSIRDMEAYPKSLSDIEKLLRYLLLDYEDLLMNIGLEEIDGEYKYQGKALNCSEIEFKTFDGQLLDVDDEELECLKVIDMESLLAYLKAVETHIKKVLQNNTIQDQIVGKYIQQASAYESGVWNIVLHPVLSKVISTFEKIKRTVSDQVLTDDNCAEFYISTLNIVCEYMAELLVACRVAIEPVFTEQYDPKKHRILKMVPVDDEAMNGQVAGIYSDCYIMEDKVIYPAKIDIYKKK